MEGRHISVQKVHRLAAGKRWVELLARVAFSGLMTRLLCAAEHRGIVRFSGLPVPGAMVTASQDNIRMVAITDEQGVYRFPDLADGLWTIHVEMPCFAPIQRDIDVRPEVPVPEWDLKLLPLEEIQAASRAAPSGTRAARSGDHTSAA
jgi:Carboxypeptidase regulatory-like domain